MFNNSSFFFSGSMGNFDAIVFHIRDMDNGHIPMPNQKRLVVRVCNDGKPAVQSDWQIPYIEKLVRNLDRVRGRMLETVVIVINVSFYDEENDFLAKISVIHLFYFTGFTMGDRRVESIFRCHEFAVMLHAMANRCVRT